MTDPTKPPTSRRRNPERAAATQQKVIEAAIQCIYDQGYEGTSLNAVATAAGVSKGAAQHHFASKAQLMAAVAHYCLKLHVAMRLEVYQQYPPGAERISHTAEASWKIINHPSYTALIEIMMATRNDPTLKALCEPLVDMIAEERRRGEAAFCADFNVAPNPLVKTLIRTHVTAMRGIAVGLRFNPDREGFREELEMMQHYERMMRELIIQQYGTKPGPATS